MPSSSRPANWLLAFNTYHNRTQDKVRITEKRADPQYRNDERKKDAPAKAAARKRDKSGKGTAKVIASLRNTKLGDLVHRENTKGVGWPPRRTAADGHVSFCHGPHCWCKTEILESITSDGITIKIPRPLTFEEGERERRNRQLTAADLVPSTKGLYPTYLKKPLKVISTIVSLTLTPQNHLTPCTSTTFECIRTYSGTKDHPSNPRRGGIRQERRLQQKERRRMQQCGCL